MNQINQIIIEGRIKFALEQGDLIKFTLDNERSNECNGKTIVTHSFINCSFYKTNPNNVKNKMDKKIKENDNVRIVGTLMSCTQNDTCNNINYILCEHIE